MRFGGFAEFHLVGAGKGRKATPENNLTGDPNFAGTRYS
jgi:hypothetical protein